MSTIPDIATLMASEVKEGPFRDSIMAPLAAVLAELPGGAAESELTVASGVVTPTAAAHTVDTESDAASDDLANVLATNHPEGRELYLRAVDAARVVTVKHEAGGAGQLHLLAGADQVLPLDRPMKFRRIGTDWYQLENVGWDDLLSVSIAGSSDTTLTAEQARTRVLALTGAVTGNKAVIFPASIKGVWVVYNATTGDYTVTAKPSGGSGVAMKLGERSVRVMYSDGSTMREVTGPRVKLLTFTRDISTASGNQAVTGLGGRPLGMILGGAVSGVAGLSSVGADDLTTQGIMANYHNLAAGSWGANTGFSVQALVDGSNYCGGKLYSKDSDGFTLVWTKVGSPTGTFSGWALCFLA